MELCSYSSLKISVVRMTLVFADLLEDASVLLSGSSSTC